MADKKEVTNLGVLTPELLERINKLNSGETTGELWDRYEQATVEEKSKIEQQYPSLFASLKINSSELEYAKQMMINSQSSITMASQNKHYLTMAHQAITISSSKYIEEMERHVVLFQDVHSLATQYFKAIELAAKSIEYMRQQALYQFEAIEYITYIKDINAKLTEIDECLFFILINLPKLPDSLLVNSADLGVFHQGFISYIHNSEKIKDLRDKTNPNKEEKNYIAKINNLSETLNVRLFKKHEHESIHSLFTIFGRCAEYFEILIHKIPFRDLNEYIPIAKEEIEKPYLAIQTLFLYGNTAQKKAGELVHKRAAKSNQALFDLWDNRHQFPENVRHSIPKFIDHIVDNGLILKPNRQPYIDRAALQNKIRKYQKEQKQLLK